MIGVSRVMPRVMITAAASTRATVVPDRATAPITRPGGIATTSRSGASTIVPGCSGSSVTPAARARIVARSLLASSSFRKASRTADSPASATSNFSSARPKIRARNGWTMSIACTRSSLACRCCRKTTPECTRTCSAVTW